MFSVPENFRVTTGVMGTSAECGNNGLFIIKPIKHGEPSLKVIASDGAGWEHVSVSTNKRCPNWEEVSCVKAMFWGEEDLVVQFHPVKSQYVNRHPYCLHLWRKSGTNDFCETPPKVLVG